MTGGDEPPGIGLGPGREFELINALVGRDPIDDDRVLLGPGDDGAALSGGLILSTDLTVEGIHFRRDWLSAREVGYRAAAAAVSDLAAMAAEPIGILVSLALPAEDAETWAPEVGVGVRGVLDLVGGSLLGGDLSLSPGPVILDVVAVGHAAEPVMRGGALPGDEVWVTGSLGGSRAAVRCFEQGAAPTQGMLEAYRRPTPRVEEARWLHQRVGLHALVDISDGLASDAGQLSASSEVHIELRADCVPVHSDLPAGVEGAQEALEGGEDYELLFTAYPGSVEPHSAEFSERFGIALSRVGEVEVGSGVSVSAPQDWGEMAEDAGFDHFRLESSR